MSEAHNHETKELSLADSTQVELDTLDELERDAQRKMTTRVTALEAEHVDSTTASRQAAEEFGELMQMIKNKRAALLEQLAQASESKSGRV